MRDPFAINLATRAAQEKTEEGKREYFRAYYTAMAVHTRKLEPKLKPLIDGFKPGSLLRNRLFVLVLVLLLVLETVA
jgi:hypothetical protein